MGKPLGMRRRPVPEPQRESWWRKHSANILLAGIALLMLALSGSVGYHFLLGPPKMGDQTVVPARGNSFFQSLGRSIFSNKLPMEPSADEMEALGIATESRRVFAGIRPEDFREKKRMYAMQKYEGGRLQADQRHQELVDEQLRRNNGPGQALRDAIEGLEQADNLGIMKLESMLTAEVNKGGPRNENVDSLIYGFQMLGEAYAKKNLKEKSRDAYLNYFRLLKDRAPAEQEPEWKNTISEFEKVAIGTTPGPKVPGN